jgi:uncharacterized membrane protein HdeD (DUF308 family)
MAPEWLTRPQNPWILVLIAGICSVVFGLLVIVHPWEGLTALIYLVSICFIVSGVATILENDERFPRTVTMVSGAILVVTGIVIMVWPDETLTVLAVLAGLGLILRGLLRAFVAFNNQVMHRAYYFVMAAVNLVLGIAIMVWPEATITVAAVLIGINVLIAGVIEIAMSFELREIGRFA